MASGQIHHSVCFGGLTKETLPKPYSGIQALNLREEGYYLVTSVAHHLGLPLAPPPVDYIDYGPGGKLHAALNEIEGKSLSESVVLLKQRP